LSLGGLYGFDELNAYRLDTKKGKERLEAQIKNLPGLLALAGIEFSKRRTILPFLKKSYQATGRVRK